MTKHPKNIKFISKKDFNFDFEKLGRSISFLLLFLFVFSSSSFCSSPFEAEIEVELELLKFEEIDSKESKKSTSLNLEKEDFKPIYHFFENKFEVHDDIIFKFNLIYIENIHLIEIPIPPPEFL